MSNSRAAKLGIGASFQQAQPVSSRRAAIHAATEAPTEGAIPPRELPVSALSLNPDNPRTELGDLTDLANSLRDHGQKTAISVMSRFAYLEGNPGRDKDLKPGAKYVVIDGNSRLAAAREAGLETIKVMVDDDLGANPDAILESSLVANIHRKDLDHLDEARALQQLLKIHGTQEALAARLHRSQPWVSSRLALLKLTPALQQRLEEGQESADLLRKVGSKKQEDQEAHLAQLKQQRAEETEARRKNAEERKARKQENADKEPQLVADARPGALAHPVQMITAEKTPVSDPRSVADLVAPKPDASRDLPATSVPSPSGATAGSAAVLATLAWDAGVALARERMEPDQRTALLHWYFRHAAGVTEVAEDLGRGLPFEHRQELSGILQQVSVLLAKDE
ncbi:ParB/RepB/Spo0J family partition protein [Streptomyces sp. NPDC096030]|uniref:ParB/RepB/Spo0J family partition protein n=1 Tax=Streptomyces sp. NPDC096030 TaxID=3155423 RepID=UPI00332F2FD7